MTGVRWCGFLALAVVAGLAAPAAAQQAPAQRPFSPSIQNQLGAVPLGPPTARSRAAMVRSIRLTQLDAALAPMGEGRELVCPDSGCQQLLTLRLDGRDEAFVADIQFVGRGSYVALQSRTLAVASVVEFEKGRPAPIFIRDEPGETVQRQLRFSVAPPGSVRALDGGTGSGTITMGNVFTRKMEPDLILQVEIGPARPAG